MDVDGVSGATSLSGAPLRTDHSHHSNVAAQKRGVPFVPSANLQVRP